MDGDPWCWGRPTLLTLTAGTFLKSLPTSSSCWLVRRSYCHFFQPPQQRKYNCYGGAVSERQLEPCDHVLAHKLVSLACILVAGLSGHNVPGHCSTFNPFLMPTLEDADLAGSVMLYKAGLTYFSSSENSSHQVNP